MEVVSDRCWLLTYFPVAWLAHVCQGMAMGILGPVQPYLALMVGVSNSSINLIWTLRALGSCLATILTGIVFKTYIRHQRLKLLFLATCVLLIGIFISLVPFAASFYHLLIAILLAGFFLGSLDTASNSLVLFMLGPLRSPPFTQSLHAMVALGFTLGSLVVRPYLPEDQDNSDIVCDASAQNNTINSNTTAFVISDDSSDPSINIDAKNIPNLVWPFSIICLVHIVCAVGYLGIICCGTTMPKFYEAVSPTEEVVSEPSMDSKPRRSISFFLIYVLAFFYFAFSCGMESFFQSQSFTFGLCGPHKLQPQDAAVLTTVYFATFLFGRFSGVFLSNLMMPKMMIITSLSSCVSITLILCFTADKYVELLYIGTGLVGFTVSFQFASGYSWLAEHIDLTGRGSSVVFLGANCGWLVFPPLAGTVFFSSIGPMGVFYLSLALAVAHLAVFSVLLKLAQSLL